MERAVALRDSTARQDTLRGRWAAWVRWKLDDRARRADLEVGIGGASTTPSKPPARPWRSRPLRDDHVDHHVDPDGLEWLIAVVTRWTGRALLTALLVPGLAVVGCWWLLVPRVGPVRPRWLAAGGAAVIVVAAIAVALLKPLSAIDAAVTLPWMWAGVSAVAAAFVARDVLGWRPPITRPTASTAPGDCPVITLDDLDSQ